MDQNFINTYILPFLQIQPGSPSNKKPCGFIDRTQNRQSRIIHQSVRLEPQIQGSVVDEIIKRCEIPSSYILYKRNKDFIPKQLNPISKSVNVRSNHSSLKAYHENQKIQKVHQKSKKQQSFLQRQSQSFEEKEESRNTFNKEYKQKETFNFDMFETKDLFATKLDFGSKCTLESDREKQSSFQTPRISEILYQRAKNDIPHQNMKAIKLSNEWQNQQIHSDMRFYQDQKKFQNVRVQLDIHRYEHQRQQNKIRINRLLLKRL
ncbi:unnamed protein product (macronuclear) [Paramecium tetraurelia]|uniref:Uncharacterized protein n=1 Tax=Paramecium tetraurelia TaxID=5888 RepID=A0E4D2_PARTE|nr:uncharacterized protein GSPATT00023323001 [Paramecium tetraurelia]CAK90149.1 unnamed protein product [Paramecium tetraurelia]|eukprot:XP_001457546.1 hypothetical protein (macronuclear) [Paramecium tetraurelia strain d4-2]